MNGVKVIRSETFHKGVFAATLTDGQSTILIDGLGHRSGWYFSADDLTALRDLLDEVLRRDGERRSGNTLPPVADAAPEEATP